MSLTSLKSTYSFLKWTGLAFAFVFGMPIVGIFTVAGVIDVLGCELSARGPSDCQFLFLNLGERFYGYAIPLVGGLLTPIAFVGAFWDFILIWGLGFWFVRKQIKTKEGDQGAS